MLEELRNFALDEFWQVIVDRFPQSTTGDLDEEDFVRLEAAADATLKVWIVNNVPKSFGSENVDHALRKAFATSVTNFPRRRAPWTLK